MRKGAVQSSSRKPGFDLRYLAWQAASFRFAIVLGVAMAPTFSQAYIGELSGGQAAYLDGLKSRSCVGADGGCASDSCCPNGQRCMRHDHWGKWACMAVQGTRRGGVRYVPPGRAESPGGPAEAAAAAPGSGSTVPVSQPQAVIRNSRPVTPQETLQILNRKAR